MASLYIKNPEPPRRLTEAARRFGITKTEAVRRALRELEREVRAAPVRHETSART